MANHDVLMTTFKPSGSAKYISVDSQAIDIKPGDSITFKNGLIPNAEISIQFFENATDKGAATPNPVSGFCDSSTPTTSFTVPKGAGATAGEAVCTVADGMENSVYLYSVSAGSAYHELDPVIIIDKPGISLFLSFLVLAVGVVAGTVVTRMYMNRKSNKPAQEAN